MSLLISMLGVMGLLSSLYWNSIFSSSSLLSLMDTLSLSLLWLMGGLILCLISNKMTMSNIVLWWWLSFSLFFSFTSADLFFFYIFFEMSLLPILILILSNGTQPERLSAGSYLLFYTTAISVPYLVIILLMGSPEFLKEKSSPLISGGLGFILLSPFFVKMPLFGVHFWLPKAHVEASTSGSMILAGLLLKLGSYGAMRVINLFLVMISFSWLSTLWVLLALFSSIITFMQSDLKKMVAYSSVTHMTFMTVGLTTCSKLSFVSVTLVSLSHGWAAMCMFAMAGVLSHASSSRLGTLIGAESALAWMIILLGLVLMSNAGVPPMPSFFPEVLLVLSSMSAGGYSIFIFLFLSLVVCYYNAYLFLWVSYLKPSSFISSKMPFSEGFLLAGFLLVSVESLLWLQLF